MAEAGCLSFSVWQTADPLIWGVEERFADAAALQHHQQRTRASLWWAQTATITRCYQISEIAPDTAADKATDKAADQCYSNYMRYISFLAIACGAILLLPALFLTAVAASDAAARCPGLQCSDALGSAAIGAVAAGIGVMLIAGGIWYLWRRRS